MYRDERRQKPEPDIAGIKDLLKKQVTRKEFLQVMGLSVLSIIGVDKLLETSPTNRVNIAGSNVDYGADEYGD